MSALRLFREGRNMYCGWQLRVEMMNRVRIVTSKRGLKGALRVETVTEGRPKALRT